MRVPKVLDSIDPRCSCSWTTAILHPVLCYREAWSPEKWWMAAEKWNPRSSTTPWLITSPPKLSLCWLYIVCTTIYNYYIQLITYNYIVSRICRTINTVDLCTFAIHWLCTLSMCTHTCAVYVLKDMWEMWAKSIQHGSQYFQRLKVSLCPSSKFHHWPGQPPLHCAHKIETKL